MKSFDRLHDVMSHYVAKGALPGLVAIVASGDEVHADAIGFSTSDGNIPMRRDTIFRLDSLTKPIVAAGAMLLVEEGLIALDALLPELADRRVLRRIDGPLDDTVPALRPITLRDLLTMRMGLGYIMGPSGSWPIQQLVNAAGILQGAQKPDCVPPPDEWMARVGSLPLMSQPGEKWMYDIAMDVLGVLMARAVGQDLGSLLRERLFAPLGMADTGFSVPADKRDRFTGAYAVDPESGALSVYDGVDASAWGIAPAFQLGACGLVATADDYLAFARMLLAGGMHQGTRILSAASIAEMTTDQITPAQKAVSPFFPGFWDTRGWGLGLSIVTAPEEGTPPGRSGWDGGIGTSAYIDPERDLIGILMTQRMDFHGMENINGDFWRGVYAGVG